MVSIPAAVGVNIQLLACAVRAADHVCQRLQDIVQCPWYDHRRQHMGIDASRIRRSAIDIGSMQRIAKKFAMMEELYSRRTR